MDVVLGRAAAVATTTVTTAMSAALWFLLPRDCMSCAQRARQTYTRIGRPQARRLPGGHR
jgi:hypothetical protein